MQAARKFESFAIDPSETFVFAGDFSGRITVVDIARWEPICEVQSHAGAITAMAASPVQPLICARSVDQTLSIWRYDGRGQLHAHAIASLRNVGPSDDERAIEPVYSESQALAFHDTEPRIVTRSGNAGVLELEYDDAGAVRVLRCHRIHGNCDPVITRYARGSDQVLSGDPSGYVILSEKGKAVRRWRILEETVHWIEHMRGTEYLVGTDARVVAHLDIAQEELLKISDPIAKDDVEQISFNRTSGLAYAASFDRHVYEIDPATCKTTRVAYNAPYKCRWLRTLQRDPARLVVLLRDGALQRVNVERGQAEATIKRTPPALWTSATTRDGSILLAGEGTDLLRLTPAGTDDFALRRLFQSQRVPLALSPTGYTKRMDIQPSTGRVVLGRTNGHVYAVEGDNDKARLLAELPGPVRDLAVMDVDKDKAAAVFVACEDGCVHKVDLDTGHVVATFTSPAGRPIWSLAYNPARGLVAALERWGTVWFLAAKDLSVVSGGDHHSTRAKRAKWLDDDVLYFAHTGELNQIDLRTGQQERVTEYLGNTVEDFIWDVGRNYLLLVVYTGMVCVHDFHSRRKLAEVRDQMDYSKGLIWTPPLKGQDTYPLDLLTFGRSGAAHGFRVYNDNLVAFGPTGPGLGDPRLAGGRAAS